MICHMPVTHHPTHHVLQSLAKVKGFQQLCLILNPGLQDCLSGHGSVFLSSICYSTQYARSLFTSFPLAPIAHA